MQDTDLTANLLPITLICWTAALAMCWVLFVLRSSDPENGGTVGDAQEQRVAARIALGLLLWPLGLLALAGLALYHLPNLFRSLKEVL